MKRNEENLPLIAELVFLCRAELHRLNLTWKSPRVLDFCEKATGKRDAHYPGEGHLKMLLSKLQELPTPQSQEEDTAA